MGPGAVGTHAVHSVHPLHPVLSQLEWLSNDVLIGLLRAEKEFIRLRWEDIATGSRKPIPIPFHRNATRLFSFAALGIAFHSSPAYFSS